MSKKKRAKSPAAAPAPAKPPTRSHTPAIAAAVVAAVAALSAAAWLARHRPNATSNAVLTPLPPPRDSTIAATPSPADFAGSERCASCHAAQYAAWRGSTHGKAGGAPGDVAVIAPFNGTPIRFRDATVIPRAAGQSYTFTVRQDGRPDRTFTVDGVVGGGHMQGGGTQGFVSRFPDGTWRFLPFDWSHHTGTWFCNTGSRAGHGWVPIAPDLSLADCGDWPPQRVLGDEPRFANCQGCHGSQIDIRLDTVAKRWTTNFTSLSINCESCHGPAKRHVDLMTSGSNADLGLRSLSTLDKNQSLGICFQCHALKSQLEKHYLPGAPLTTYYAVRLAQLGDTTPLPDGRTRTFAYQEGHLSSACYVKGGMTCTSCHDPHSQTYRDAFGAPLVGRFDDRQCTSCHASKATNPQAHTKHAPNSAGSRCTSCHMPYLQEQEVGTAIRYTRSDHTISIPRPAFDSSEGLTSSCKGCHADRSVTALDAQVRTWYGTLAPHDPAVGGAVAASTATSRADAARLLLATDSRHTSALFGGLSAFVERWLTPDMPELERDVTSRLRTLTQHQDRDVRATALAALHFARGQDAGTRAFLASTLGQLDPGEDGVIRGRWALVLGFLADRLLAHGSADASVATYRKALEIKPRSPALFLNLGLAQLQAGDAAGAIASYRESLTLDPAQPLVLVNLGIALESQSDAAGAERAYRRATELDPNEPLAWFNLGNVALKSGDAAAAISRYEKATSLDPSLSKGWFYLADALARTGALPRALEAVRRGIEFDPKNAEAKSVEARLKQALGR